MLKRERDIFITLTLKPSWFQLLGFNPPPPPQSLSLGYCTLKVLQSPIYTYTEKKLLL